MHANLRECRAAGINHLRVYRIARRLSHAMAEAQELGITLFGSNGHGTLRYRDDPSKPPLILASVDGVIDGREGVALTGEDNLLRGA